MGMWHVYGTTEMYKAFWWGTPKGKYNLENPSVAGGIYNDY
jgi:hypothetical protein